MSLWFNYGVKKIYGVKWGYQGFYKDGGAHWVKLDPKFVGGIHNKGGTVLGSSRGQGDAA
jgi:6-phosphofructokinase 1